MRVVVVTPIPTPYRDPFWDCFAQQEDVELTVIYCSTGRSDRPWRDDATNGHYRRLFPKTRNLMSYAGWGASCYWTPGIPRLLAELNPDVVLLGGYNHVTMLSAAKHCRRQGIPFFLMCETWRQRGGVRGAVKHWLIRRWLRNAAGALPTGSLASAYLESLGVPAARQCRLPNVPDIESLESYSKTSAGDRRAHRERLGVKPDSHVVLYAARMVPKKRPDVVLDAFSRLDARTETRLVMLGDGPDLTTIQARAKELSCQDRVDFKGFVEPGVVHEWMVAADVFVQPSSETWGVAPIESVACGCPVILSREIGCHADLLSNESDGVVLESVEPDNLARAIAVTLERGRIDRGDCADSHWIQRNRYTVLAERLCVFLKQRIRGGDR